MSDRRAGFTLVEVVMAVVVLVFGILVLASSAAGISRMLSSGQGKTRAAAYASARIEELRNIAAGSDPRCDPAALRDGTASQPGGFTEQWTVSGTGATRRIQVIVQYRNGPRPQADTVGAVILC